MNGINPAIGRFTKDLVPLHMLRLTAIGYRKKFGYDYYPAANVYYDRSRKVYFYMSGHDWNVGVSLPSTLRIDVNEAVSLELSTDKPYLENEEHVKMVKYKHKGKGPKHKNQPRHW